MTRKRTITESLERWCSAKFPYVCAGEKFIGPNQHVSCDCGNDTAMREDYEAILLVNKV